MYEVRVERILVSDTTSHPACLERHAYQNSRAVSSGIASSPSLALLPSRALQRTCAETTQSRPSVRQIDIAVVMAETPCWQVPLCPSRSWSLVLSAACWCFPRCTDPREEARLESRETGPWGSNVGDRSRLPHVIDNTPYLRKSVGIVRAVLCSSCLFFLFAFCSLSGGGLRPAQRRTSRPLNVSAGTLRRLRRWGDFLTLVAF
jgi:hypothetical protein